LFTINTPGLARQTISPITNHVPKLVELHLSSGILLLQNNEVVVFDNIPEKVHFQRPPNFE